MLINGIKFACNTCIKGHRSSNCNHVERPLFEIRKKGRPVTQCAFCRDLRKTRQIHIKCTCTDKSKNIENPATCYQCPSSKPVSSGLVTAAAVEEQGIAYSDLIQTSLTSATTHGSTFQCTCHEAANKLMSQQQQQQEQVNNVWQESLTPILPIHTNDVNYHNNQLQKSSSFRFLGGQAKSPRRKSSTSSNKSSSSSRRRSSNLQQLHQQEDVNMQALLLNQLKNESDDMMATNTTFPYHSSTSTSSTSTPSSVCNNNQNFNSFNNQELELMMNTTDPNELTLLLNDVLDENIKQEQSEENRMIEAPFNNASSVSMGRSTTNNSTSSSSSHYGRNYIMPQQQAVCGSVAPHSNCAPAINTQGESVVITITPLVGRNEERKDSDQITRIITCYCGISCICPGCFVHPNNYLQNISFMQSQSSNSSTYSSEDEDRMNYSFL